MNDPALLNEIREIRDRVRRIETRVTITGRHVGADVGGGKPTWCQPAAGGSGVVEVPTPNVSLAEIMRVIPKGWSGGFHIYINGDYLFSGTIVPQ